MPNFRPNASRVVIQINTNDHVRADHARALHHVQADAAQAEHHHVGARLHFRGVDHRADAGGDAAADVADLVEGRVGADFRQRDLGQHGEIGESRATHVVMDCFFTQTETGSAVRHDSLTLRTPDCRTQVRFPRQAGLALPALRRIERDDVVALLQRGHARADVDHDAGALVAEDRREKPFRISAGARELVGVADARGLDLDQDLAGLGAIEIHRFDDQRRAGLVRDCGFDFHAFSKSCQRKMAK